MNSSPRPATTAYCLVRAGRLELAWPAALSLLLVSSSGAWQVPDRLLTRDAARYFELTATQLRALTGVESSWNEYRDSAKQRADRIEAEIDQETRRSNLDPAALGQRYVDWKPSAANRKRDGRDRWLTRVVS